MSFKSDKDGFLIAADAAQAMRHMDRTLERIRIDVSTIKAAVANSPRMAPKGASPSIAVPLGRGRGQVLPLTNGHRSIAGAAAGAANSVRYAGGRAVAEPTSRMQNLKTVAVPLSGRGKITGGHGQGVEPTRDGSGRFTSNGSGLAEGNRILRTMATKLSGVTVAAGSVLGDADPTARAIQEVTEPFGRGMSMMGGLGGNADQRKERWYRRIFNTLNVFRKEEAAANKDQLKRLKGIEEKPVSGSRGPGMLSSLLTRIPLIGPALAALAGGAAAMGGKALKAGGSLLRRVPGVGKMMGGAGEAAQVAGETGILAKVSKLGGGFLKRLPLIGTLLAGAGAATEVYASETDDQLTRREKDQNAGRAVGGLAGSIGGMAGGAAMGAAIGTAILPGIGTAIGGALGGIAGMFSGDKVGQVLGETFGGWVSDLRDADIPGKITSAWAGVTAVASAAWDEVTGAARSFWDGATAKASSIWDGIGQAATGANDAIKAFTGIDIKGMVGGAVDMLSRAASSVVSWLETKTGETLDRVKKTASDALDSASKFVAESTPVKAVKSVMNWVGQKYRQATFNDVAEARAFQGGGTVRGLSDAQTRALASNTAKTESYGKNNEVNEYGYAGRYQMGAAALVGEGLIDRDKYEAARKTKGFRQKDFMQDASNWTIKGGMDTFLGDKALQDRTYLSYTNKNVQGGFASKALNGSSSAEDIAAYAKAAHLKGTGGANALFKAGHITKDANGTSTAEYAAQAREAMQTTAVALASRGAAPALKTGGALQVAANSPSAVPIATPLAAPVTTFKPPAAIPQMQPPTSPRLEPVQDQPVRLGTEKPKPVQVVVRGGDAGQDVQDRRIAHVVTGGLGGNRHG